MQNVSKYTVCDELHQMNSRFLMSWNMTGLVDILRLTLIICHKPNSRKGDANHLSPVRLWLTSNPICRVRVYANRTLGRDRKSVGLGSISAFSDTISRGS